LAEWRLAVETVAPAVMIGPINRGAGAMPCLTRTFARLAFAGLLAAILPAATASAEKRIAISIGIDTYDNLKPDQQLRKAVNDSRSVGAALASVGFEIISGENVPRLEFNRIWQRFLNRIEPGDTVSVFFAGHGVEIGGSNFLLARDVPKMTAGEDELLRGETIALSRLLEDLRGRQPKVSVIILDACRNNPFQQQGGRSVGGSRGLARIEAPEGTFVMFSAGTGEAALDRLGDADGEAKSIYTRKLVPLLTRSGLSLPDMAQEVRRQVRDLAASVRHRQTPAYYDEVVGRFCLASCGDGEKPAQLAAATPILPLPPLEPAPARISAPNEALPTDLPVRPEVLRVVDTDPFFANAPPVRVGAHTVISNLSFTTGGAGTSTSSYNDETATRWLRSGLIRQDLVQSYTVNNSGSTGRYASRSSSLGIANGLLTLSYKMTTTSGQPRMTTTSQVLRIENTRGRIFPVTLGNTFSYDSVHEWKSTSGYSGGSTYRNSCTVTKKFDAKTFHASLTGDVYLLVCDTESTDKNGSVTKAKSRDIFVDMLGVWLRADPTSPKEQVISSNDISVSGKYTTVTNGSYVLTSFGLVR
jgi:hypothetical protein